jgi:hypothetical protein
MQCQEKEIYKLYVKIKERVEIFMTYFKVNVFRNSS